MHAVPPAQDHLRYTTGKGQAMSELFRQTVHLLMGVVGAAIIVSLQPGTAFIFFGFVLFVAFLFLDIMTRGYDLPVIEPLLDEAERTGRVPMKGGIAFAIGALLSYAVFGPLLAAAGIVTLGVLDSVATVAGTRIGRHTIYRKKSLEGTVAGIAAAIVALCIYIPFLTGIAVSPALALLAAAVAGLVEVFSPVDDNLLIPPAVCTVFFLAGW